MTPRDVVKAAALRPASVEQLHRMLSGQCSVAARIHIDVGCGMYEAHWSATDSVVRTILRELIAEGGT